MFCTQCGKRISDDAHFCPHCGSPTGGAPIEHGLRAGSAGTKTDASSEASGPAANAGGAEPANSDGNLDGLTAADSSTFPDASAAGEGPAVAPEAASVASRGNADASQPTVDAGTPKATAAPMAVGASMSQATAESAPDATAGDINAQVAEARKSAKRKMPLFLLVVLVALSVAGAAFAATMVWRYVIAPALEARQEVVVEAVTEPPAESEPAATTEAETTDNTAAQQAVFNDILTEYKAAQDSGWTANDSQAVDIQSLCHAMAGISRGSGQGAANSTIAYSYTDLGNDGVLDLVIGGLQSDGSHSVYGVFASDGSTSTSIMQGDLGARSWWSVLSDGTLFNHGSGGVNTLAAVVYTIEGGQRVRTDSFGYNYDDVNGSQQRYYWHGSTDNRITEAEYNALRDSLPAEATLDWCPLSEFSPIEP